uniref:Uncharacterized protein n=1 Tax=Anguilla anguilla TaxID=7936 RepID=A0A0E9QN22_ANGAN
MQRSSGDFFKWPVIFHKFMKNIKLAIHSENHRYILFLCVSNWSLLINCL